MDKFLKTRYQPAITESTGMYVGSQKMALVSGPLAPALAFGIRIKQYKYKTYPAAKNFNFEIKFYKQHSSLQK